MKNYSAKDTPEKCLAAMIKRDACMARMLLDKCVIDVKDRSKITYDFFCLESKGNINILYTVYRTFTQVSESALLEYGLILPLFVFINIDCFVQSIIH